MLKGVKYKLMLTFLHISEIRYMIQRLISFQQYFPLMLTLLDISEMCSMFQKLNSYNLLTDKVAEKVP